MSRNRKCLESVKILVFFLVCTMSRLLKTEIITTLTLPSFPMYLVSTGLDHMMFSVTDGTNSWVFYLDLTSGDLSELYLGPFISGLETFQTHSATEINFIQAFNTGNMIQFQLNNTIHITSLMTFQIEYGDNSSHFFTVCLQPTNLLLKQYNSGIQVSSEALPQIKIYKLYYIKETGCLYIFQPSHFPPTFQSVQSSSTSIAPENPHQFILLLLFMPPILLQFQSNLLIKRCTNLTLSLPYSSYNRIAVNQQYLAINTLGETISIYEPTNLTLLYTINSVGIRSVEVKGNILYYIQGGAIHQYNIEANKLLDSMDSPLGDATEIIFYSGNSNLFLYTYNDPRIWRVHADIPLQINQPPSSFLNQTQFPFAQTLKNSLVVSNFKLNFKALVPLFLFVEDIWPYQFHADIKYTDFMKQCMVQSDFIDTIKYHPPILKELSKVEERVTTYLSQKNQCIQENGSRQNSPLSGFSAMWIYSSLDYLFWGIPFTFSIFLCLKMLEWVLKITCCKKLQAQSKTQKLFISLQHRTRKWLIFTFFFETGLTKTSMACFNQLAYPSFDGFLQKVSFALCVCFLGLILLYSFHFFTYIKRHHKNSSKLALVLSKQNHLGYCLDSFILIIHKIVRGFIHSSLIMTHSMKIYLLIGVEVVQIIVYVRLRKYFLNKFVFFTFMCYNIGFVALNCTLYLNYQKNTGSKMIVTASSQTLEQIIDNEIKVLILSTVLISLGVFVHQIIDLVKEFCAPNNKISEEEHNNNQANERNEMQQQIENKDQGNIFSRQNWQDQQNFQKTSKDVDSEDIKKNVKDKEKKKQPKIDEMDEIGEIDMKSVKNSQIKKEGKTNKSQKQFQKKKEKRSSQNPKREKTKKTKKTKKTDKNLIVKQEDGGSENIEEFIITNKNEEFLGFRGQQNFKISFDFQKMVQHFDANTLPT